MENFAEKLQEYRLRKRRQERIENIKSKLRRFVMLGVGVENPGDTDESKSADASPDCPSDKRLIDNRIPPSTDENLQTIIEDDEFNSATSAMQLISEDDSTNDAAPKEHPIYKYTMWLLSFIFWVTVYAIAIELQFGTVYFILSLIVGIYINTRTGPKRPDELSAYSVFNKNCESIDGTLKAEQFERELGIR